MHEIPPKEFMDDDNTVPDEMITIYVGNGFGNGCENDSSRIYADKYAGNLMNLKGNNAGNSNGKE
eukprot:657232-Amphidinium_carterae.1